MDLVGCRVLVVDDERLVQNLLVRALERSGATVSVASTVAEAGARIRSDTFDILFVDLDLDGEDGLCVVESSKSRQPAASVVILTGKTELESAIRAVSLGVSQYLRKPLGLVELRDVARAAFDAARGSRALLQERAHLEDLRENGRLRQESLVARFESALATMHMAYQPIVDLELQRATAWEALVRTEAPGVGPLDLFAMAESLDRVSQLSAAIRELVAEDLRAAPPDTQVFLNLHAQDLMDGGILDPQGPLVDFAKRIVVEVTERAAVHDLEALHPHIARLRELGYRIALDDMGAGYAGLSSFASLCPHLAKIDRSLVSGADGDPLRRHIVRTLVAMCEELAVPVVAEGIETASEAEVMQTIGCRYGQGYYFARPLRGGLGAPVLSDHQFVMPC